MRKKQLPITDEQAARCLDDFPPESQADIWAIYLEQRQTEIPAESWRRTMIGIVFLVLVQEEQKKRLN